MQKKRILFVCKHNLFRSQIAKLIFNKFNKNPNYVADSAGIIRWDKDDLGRNIGFKIEQEVAKKKGLEMKNNSKELNSALLGKTDILIIVADDVPASLLETEPSFNGKIIVWKITDVKKEDKDKEKIALRTIEFIEKKVKEFIKNF